MRVRDLEFVGSSLNDLRAFPEDVKHDVGVALMEVQFGGMPTSAKPLKGFGGASVLEIVERHEHDTYRAVYTVRFETAVYVLHAFQKKSKHGVATPLQHIKRIQERLAWAAEIEAQRLAQWEEKSNE